MITREPFKGAAVRFFSRQDVHDLYEVREVLHQQAALRIRRLDDAAWIQALERLQRDHERAVAGLDLMAVFTANKAFHDTLFQGTGNRYFVRAIEYSNALTHCIRSHALKHPQFLSRACEEHRAITALVKARDLSALARLCLDHMQPARRYYEEKFCDPPAVAAAGDTPASGV
ncbi:DNA-binding GntR family transcriptional regulator [Roseospira visakhapatnamensis]|uniref:DNA-binding GntR family transcriptional regulator n=2 Tax=Roseospira visakhapatnamensis TaxID=390880 RepID=A0A7W6W9N0_9PROT|nr:DNA-binding GntR family transcriptional regulator [Roseospira visakhapatnamensis]